MNLPKHKCSLSITHNEHKDYYESAEERIGITNPKWKSDEAKRMAIETDSVWVMHWYPDNPIGSICVASPTLEELLEFALEVEDGK